MKKNVFLSIKTTTADLSTRCYVGVFGLKDFSLPRTSMQGFHCNHANWSYLIMGKLLLQQLVKQLKNKQISYCCFFVFLRCCCCWPWVIRQIDWLGQQGKQLTYEDHLCAIPLAGAWIGAKWYPNYSESISTPWELLDLASHHLSR